MAASFHLPSVSTATINPVQYIKPYQQSELLTIPAVVISKVRVPQSNIMAAVVHNHSSLFFDVSSFLPKYNKYNITKFKFLFSTATCCRTPQTPAQMSNCQHKAAHINLSMPHRNVLVTLFNWVTNCEYWIVAEWNSRYRLRLVLEKVYWMRIGISMIISIYNIFIKFRIN